jgi:cohesin complex subunit SCC1
LYNFCYQLGPIGSRCSQESTESHFSLGATNAVIDTEMKLNLGDDNDHKEATERQVAGDDIILSTSKWHANTQKVFAMLKRNMALPSYEHDPNQHDNDKPNHLMFDQMSMGTSRRTAAGVFFELLQLKTWDYIDLEQDASYGDIKILPGLKFTEDPPTN